MNGYYLAGSCISTTQYHAAGPVGGDPSRSPSRRKPSSCRLCCAQAIDRVTIEAGKVTMHCGACGRDHVLGEAVPKRVIETTAEVVGEGCAA